MHYHATPPTHPRTHALLNHSSLSHFFRTHLPPPRFCMPCTNHCTVPSCSQPLAYTHRAPVAAPPPTLHLQLATHFLQHTPAGASGNAASPPLRTASTFNNTRLQPHTASHQCLAYNCTQLLTNACHSPVVGMVIPTITFTYPTFHYPSLHLHLCRLIFRWNLALHLVTAQPAAQVFYAHQYGLCCTSPTSAASAAPPLDRCGPACTTLCAHPPCSWLCASPALPGNRAHTGIIPSFEHMAPPGQRSAAPSTFLA